MVQQSREMHAEYVRGQRAALAGKELPSDSSEAYAKGWNSGREKVGAIPLGNNVTAEVEQPIATTTVVSKPARSSPLTDKSKWIPWTAERIAAEGKTQANISAIHWMTRDYADKLGLINVGPLSITADELKTLMQLGLWHTASPGQ